MTPEELKSYVDGILREKINRALGILEIEGQKSIKRNFELGGRPPWPKSKKKSGKTLIMSGNLSNVLVTRNDAERSVTFTSNPLARAYARIHQEGGTINMPARQLKFRKNKTGRTVFASRKHKRIVKETTSKPHTVRIPARPYMVIPMEDIEKITQLIERA